MLHALPNFVATKVPQIKNKYKIVATMVHLVKNNRRFVQLNAYTMRDETLKVRVSQTEKEGFEKAAEVSGLGFSAWARQTLRTAAINKLHEANEKVPFLKPVPLKNTNG